MCFDYVIVGGGTAGSLLASRLSENTDISVCLIEWGPDDRDEERAKSLRRWAEMVSSEHDLDYRYTPQLRGNSMIRQTRMRLLGGCSNTNTMIAWKPLQGDLEEWARLGAHGWTAENFLPYYDKLLTQIQPVAESDRHPMVADAVAAAADALRVPLQSCWNDGRLDDRAAGAGFFEVGYDPLTNQRGATSLDYLHPAMARPNLTVKLGKRCVKIELTAPPYPKATGVIMEDGEIVRASREVLVCAGAIDSPRLLQLSGIGPRDVLDAANVPCIVDLPGVGENLQDHAEGLVVWESTRQVATAPCASGWDAGCMFKTNADGTKLPDVLCHFPVEPWVTHAEALGYRFPRHIISLTPNVAKPSSRGRVWITSADPSVPPSIDPRYFTDKEGHDEKVLVDGVRACRKIAETDPFRQWIKREIFPGPEFQTFEEISKVERAAHQTVYHMSCTCAMGTVLDPELRVRNVRSLRVIDASSFPSLTSVNPVITIEMLAERAADIIRNDDIASKL